MTHQNPPEHFKGKNVAEHLKEARQRGALAASEVHGTELPGFRAALADAIRDTAILFLILWALSEGLYLDTQTILILFIAFGFGLVIWKTARSAILGWSRLERLHKVIEEERYEIEHHREQEKKELREMYAAKGLSGKLLDEVVEVLMADDNRLLCVMLEEELGLSLEVHEHPLKQAAGAFLGTFLVAVAEIIVFYFWSSFGIPVLSTLAVAFAADKIARGEKRRRMPSLIWNASLAIFIGTSIYFLTKLISG